MLFTLTEAALDIGTAVIWWSIKNTYYGVSGAYNYFFSPQESNQDLCESIQLQIKNCSCVGKCNCM
tara:strand:+ start:1325 stop:1522 length:198 start_codon:yes stop_codon:yes gene_type:complete